MVHYGAGGLASDEAHRQAAWWTGRPAGVEVRLPDRRQAEGEGQVGPWAQGQTQRFVWMRRKQGIQMANPSPQSRTPPTRCVCSNARPMQSRMHAEVVLVTPKRVRR